MNLAEAINKATEYTQRWKRLESHLTRWSLIFTVASMILTGGAAQGVLSGNVIADHLHFLKIADSKATDSKPNATSGWKVICLAAAICSLTAAVLTFVLKASGCGQHKSEGAMCVATLEEQDPAGPDQQIRGLLAKVKAKYPDIFFA